MPPRRNAIAKRRYRTSPALSRARNELDKYRKKLAVMRKNNKSAKSYTPTESFECAAYTAGGGAAAGWVSNSAYGEVAGFDTRLVAGLGLVLFSAYTNTGAGKISLGVGSGMLASYASDFTAGN